MPPRPRERRPCIVATSPITSIAISKLCGPSFDTGAKPATRVILRLEWLEPHRP